MLQRKGSGLWNIWVIGGAIVAMPFVFSVVYNLSRASGAVRRFAEYSFSFQYFFDRDTLSIDGKIWKVAGKDVRQMSRLIQYLPEGQTLSSSTESFLYLEVLALPPITAGTAMDFALNEKKTFLLKDCPSGQLSVLRRENNFMTLDFRCQESKSYYSLSGIAFDDGVVSTLAYDRAQTSDLAGVKEVWGARVRSLLQHHLWQ